MLMASINKAIARGQAAVFIYNDYRAQVGIEANGGAVQRTASEVEVMMHSVLDNVTVNDKLEGVMRCAIQAALSRHENVKEAAGYLGMHWQTLYAEMRRLDIPSPHKVKKIDNALDAKKVTQLERPHDVDAVADAG